MTVMKMAPPVLKDRAGFPAFREKIKVFSKYNGFESVLTLDPHLDIGSTEREVSLRRGVPPGVYERRFRAWAYFSQAFELPTDVGRFRRSTSPRGLWASTLKWYSAQTVGQQVVLRKKLHNFQIPKGSDPVQKMLEIEDHAEQMSDAGMHVDDQDVYSTYVSAIPSEYDLEIRELSRNHVLDRNEIINLVQSQYDLLAKKKKSSPAAHALLVERCGRGA